MAASQKSQKEKAVTVVLYKERETPGTFLYREVLDGPPKIKSQYLQKWVAQQLGNPEKIEITIKAAK